LKIKVIDVSAPESQGNGPRRYSAINITYKDEDFGKVASKKLVSFNNPEVYKFLSEAKKDDVIDIETVKNEKGFWDWNAIRGPTADGSEATPEKSFVPRSATSTPARTTYETPDERALRQRLIVRQSSFGHAVTLIPKAPVVDLFKLAEQIETWVYRKDAVQELIDLKDDIPQ